ncbi:MAG: AAA family ATPase [Ramlibacter sp.]|nr:AAA family ATPase [Ramlibacter sp.]
MTKYLSAGRVRECINHLSAFHIFFGTTFLVMTKSRVPVGTVGRLSLDAENRLHLQKYFRVHPKSDCFFTPFQVKKSEGRWRAPKYASTSLQAINTQGFSEAILHKKNENLWGWAPKYHEVLVEKLPRDGRKISLLDMAIWFAREEPFSDSVTTTDLIDWFVKLFNLRNVDIDKLFTWPSKHDLQTSIWDTTPPRWDDLVEEFGLPGDVAPQGGAILQSLEFSNIGPPKKLSASLAPRLNVLTGDNGLGKTFFLDVAWWALTRTWAEHMLVPLEPVATPPQIRFSVSNGANQKPVEAEFDANKGVWKVAAPSAISGLVVYGRVDGSFAVWDPANPAIGGRDSRSAPSVASFTRESVWTGDDKVEGLLRDWVRWQTRADEFPAFETFKKVVQRLKPPELGEFEIGRPQRVQGWSMEIPSLVHSYGTVPVIYESAGIRRILTLTYLIVWAWEEHKIQARAAGRREERQMIILLDEAEAHLHPRWQRVLLQALLGISKDLHEELSIQFILASHSPLLLASAESVWNVEEDKLFHLQIDKDGEIRFDSIEFEILGSVDSWLRSPSFDNLHPGSESAEQSLAEAKALIAEKNPSRQRIREVSRSLANNVAADDPFWMRWMIFATQNEVDL